MSREAKTGIPLNTLGIGESAVIHRLLGDKVSRQRLMALGIVTGHQIALDTSAPMGDPGIYSILGYRLSIRREDAEKILVSEPARGVSTTP